MLFLCAAVPHGGAGVSDMEDHEWLAAAAAGAAGKGAGADAGAESGAAGAQGAGE